MPVKCAGPLYIIMFQFVVAEQNDILLQLTIEGIHITTRRVLYKSHTPIIEAHDLLVSCPPRARLPARNGLVNEVKFLGLIPQNGERPMRLRDR